jgi:formylmethanofuran dehydrogenase subunit E
MAKHATVRVGGFEIPLIGLPKSSTLEECDLCHDEFHLTEIEYNGKQFLCERCREQANEN